MQRLKVAVKTKVKERGSVDNQSVDRRGKRLIQMFTLDTFGVHKNKFPYFWYIPSQQFYVIIT